MSASPALLHYAASETDADMYYATGFLAPDAFAWFRAGGRDHLLASDLEIGRARDEAGVHSVLSLTEYRERARRFLLACDVIQQHREFITTYAAKNITLSHTQFNTLGDLA